jgi:iron complex transport system ATP-binding protein
LLRLLLRHIYPSIVAGPPAVIEILGSDVWNVWDMRRGMGIVSAELDRSFPDAAVLPPTSLQAVLTGFFGSQLPPPPSAITASMRERAIECLHRVEIDWLAERPINTLSTGELRRVLIARALVHEPRALILDEPTAGLDMAARFKFLNLLRDLSHTGTAMILVTHHVEEILPEIKRVLLMSAGRIVADGDKQEVLTSKQLEEVFEVKMDVRLGSYGYFTAIPQL